MIREDDENTDILPEMPTYGKFALLYGDLQSELESETNPQLLTTNETKAQKRLKGQKGPLNSTQKLKAELITTLKGEKMNINNLRLKRLCTDLNTALKGASKSDSDCLELLVTICSCISDNQIVDDRGSYCSMLIRTGVLDLFSSILRLEHSETDSLAVRAAVLEMLDNIVGYNEEVANLFCGSKVLLSSAVEIFKSTLIAMKRTEAQVLVNAVLWLCKGYHSVPRRISILCQSGFCELIMEILSQFRKDVVIVKCVSKAVYLFLFHNIVISKDHLIAAGAPEKLRPALERYPNKSSPTSDLDPETASIADLCTASLSYLNRK